MVLSDQLIEEIKSWYCDVMTSKRTWTLFQEMCPGLVKLREELLRFEYMLPFYLRESVLLEEPLPIPSDEDVKILLEQGRRDMEERGGVCAVCDEWVVRQHGRRLAVFRLEDVPPSFWEALQPAPGKDLSEKFCKEHDISCFLNESQREEFGEMVGKVLLSPRGVVLAMPSERADASGEKEEEDEEEELDFEGKEKEREARVKICEACLGALKRKANTEDGVLMPPAYSITNIPIGW